MIETREESKLRERALTLLLIERDQIAEQLARLGYGQLLPDKKPRYTAESSQEPTQLPAAK